MNWFFKALEFHDKHNHQEGRSKSVRSTEKNSEQSKSNEACYLELKKCEICCRQFESVSELKYHFEICKKGLECNNYQKSFETVESFKEHSNICDGVNTYRCFVCGKKFESDINCLTHMKKCSGMLPCKRCDKMCATYKILLQHNRVFHEQLNCDICKKIFYVKSQLLDHIEKHEKK